MRRQLAHSEDGATLVEFALVASVFFTLVFGLFDISRLHYIRNNLQFAADEAGCHALINSGASGAQISAVVTQNVVAVSPQNVTVTVQNQTINGRNYRAISVAYTFSSVVGSLVNMNNIPITVQSVVPAV